MLLLAVIERSLRRFASVRRGVRRGSWRVAAAHPPSWGPTELHPGRHESHSHTGRVGRSGQASCKPLNPAHRRRCRRRRCCWCSSHGWLASGPQSASLVIQTTRTPLTYTADRWARQAALPGECGWLRQVRWPSHVSRQCARCRPTTMPLAWQRLAGGGEAARQRRRTPPAPAAATAAAAEPAAAAAAAVRRGRTWYPCNTEALLWRRSSQRECSRKGSRVPPLRGQPEAQSTVQLGRWGSQ